MGLLVNGLTSSSEFVVGRLPKFVVGFLPIFVVGLFPKFVVGLYPNSGPCWGWWWWWGWLFQGRYSGENPKSLSYPSLAPKILKLKEIILINK